MSPPRSPSIDIDNDLIALSNSPLLSWAEETFVVDNGKENGNLLVQLMGFFIAPFDPNGVLQATYQLTDTNRMVLSTRQKELVAVLDGNLANGSIEHIVDGILQLSLSVLEQNLPRSRFESPLLHFLAIIALDPVERVWIDASEYVSVLIGVVHVGKIIILNHRCLSHPYRDVTSFKTYCREQLEGGSLKYWQFQDSRSHHASSVCDGGDSEGHQQVCVTDYLGMDLSESYTPSCQSAKAFTLV